MSLEFNPDGHVYTLDGVRVPSVTTVLELLEDFSCVPFDVLEAARVFGQHVHSACDLFDRGDLDWKSLDPLLVPYVEGWARFLEESGAVVLASELRVSSKRLRVAGTLDALVRWRDAEAVIDRKSTAAVPRTVGPQTWGYEQLYREEHGGPARKRHCVQLKPDGTYRVHHLTDPRDGAIFQSALNIWWWRNGDGIAA